ncbi:MAG: prevent-host-death protein [Acidobacteria bacterium]|nr:prevent-host-death protein [Acidobacteriota bacterium]
MKTISKSRLKARMLQVFREIEEEGGELIVTDHNQPVLKIVAIPKKKDIRELFADAQGKVVFLEDLTTPTRDEWELT